MTDESGEKRSLNERFYRSVQFTAGPLIVNHLFISSIRHSYHLPHQTPSAPISQSCSLLYFHLNCSASIACQWVEADLVIPITSIEISSNRELTTDYYCDSLLPLLPHLLPHPPTLPHSIHLVTDHNWEEGESSVSSVRSEIHLSQTELSWAPA